MTLTDIYDGAFLEKTVNGFQGLTFFIKKLDHRYITG